jgi:2-keto-4-pentenoate hydratase
MASIEDSGSGSTEATAARFVAARRARTGLAHFPGSLTESLAAAYAIQEATTTSWPDSIAGWKVGRIARPLSDRLGVDRLIGPIFQTTVTRTTGYADFPAFRGGFAAFEAEFVIVAAEDAPLGRTAWTSDEASDLAGAMHIGIEVAGSPLASINDLGPLATIAGFGNNNGLILGPEVPDWRSLPLDDLTCTSSVDGRIVRAATAAAIPGGPLTAFAFALGMAAQLGRSIRAGQMISTGAVTGIIPVVIGQACVADFGRFGRLACTVVEA